MLSIKTERLLAEHELTKLGFSSKELEKAIYKCIPAYGTKVPGSREVTSIDEPVVMWDSASNKFTICSEDPKEQSKKGLLVDSFYSDLELNYYSYSTPLNYNQYIVGWRYYKSDLLHSSEYVQFEKTITKEDKISFDKIAFAAEAVGCSLPTDLRVGNGLVINMEYKNDKWHFLYAYKYNKSSKYPTKVIDYLNSIIKVEGTLKADTKYFSRLVSAYDMSVSVLTELLNSQESSALWGHKATILKPAITQNILKSDFYPDFKVFDLLSKVQFKYSISNVEELKSEPFIRQMSWGTRAKIPLVFNSGTQRNSLNRVGTATVDIYLNTDLEVDIEIKSEVGKFTENRHYTYSSY